MQQKEEINELTLLPKKGDTVKLKPNNFVRQANICDTSDFLASAKEIGYEPNIICNLMVEHNINGFGNMGFFRINNECLVAFDYPKEITNIMKRLLKETNGEEILLIGS